MVESNTGSPEYHCLKCGGKPSPTSRPVAIMNVPRSLRVCRDFDHPSDLLLGFR